MEAIRPDHKPDGGSLSVSEKEALIAELTDVMGQMYNALLSKEALSQQLDVAEQDKEKEEEEEEEEA